MVAVVESVGTDAEPEGEGEGVADVDAIEDGAGVGAPLRFVVVSGAEDDFGGEVPAFGEEGSDLAVIETEDVAFGFDEGPVLGFGNFDDGGGFVFEPGVEGDFADVVEESGGEGGVVSDEAGALGDGLGPEGGSMAVDPEGAGFEGVAVERPREPGVGGGNEAKVFDAAHPEDDDGIGEAGDLPAEAIVGAVGEAQDSRGEGGVLGEGARDGEA